MSKYDIDKLKRQLSQAELRESIENEIKKSRCPLCGSEIKCESRAGRCRYDDNGYVSVSIRCTGCSIFGTDVTKEWSFWDSNGYSETDVIDEVWREVKPYVKEGE